jgi:hypothetical protein
VPNACARADSVGASTWNAWPIVASTGASAPAICPITGPTAVASWPNPVASV